MSYNPPPYPPPNDASRHRNGSPKPPNIILSFPQQPPFGDVFQQMPCDVTGPPSPTMPTAFAFSGVLSWEQQESERDDEWRSNPVEILHTRSRTLEGEFNSMLLSSPRSMPQFSSTVVHDTTYLGGSSITRESETGPTNGFMGPSQANNGDNYILERSRQASGVPSPGLMIHPSNMPLTNYLNGGPSGQILPPPPPYNPSSIGHYPLQHNTLTFPSADPSRLSSPPDEFTHHDPAAPLHAQAMPKPQLNQWHKHPSVSPVLPHSSRHVRRSQPQVDVMNKAFTDNSEYPNYYLRACFNRLLVLGIHLRKEVEPDYNSPEGSLILDVSPTEIKNVRPGTSIYNIFINSEKKKCLLCGEQKSCIPRVLGCIRAHLGHRPFSCRGKEVGCERCIEGEESARFFTIALLRDHITGPINKSVCPKCDAKFRRGGVKRHWEKRHKEDELP